MEMAAGGSLTSYVADKWQKAQAQGLFLSEDEARFFFKARRGALLAAPQTGCASAAPACVRLACSATHPALTLRCGAVARSSCCPLSIRARPLPAAAIPVGRQVLPRALRGAPRPEAGQHAAGWVSRCAGPWRRPGPRPAATAALARQGPCLPTPCCLHTPRPGSAAANRLSSRSATLGLPRHGARRPTCSRRSGGRGPGPGAQASNPRARAACGWGWGRSGPPPALPPCAVLCSTPVYMSPELINSKNGKVRRPCAGGHADARFSCTRPT